MTYYVCCVLTCDLNVEGLLCLVPDAVVRLAGDLAAPPAPGARDQQTEPPAQVLAPGPQPDQARVRRARGRAPDQHIITRDMG